eukprot:GILK01010405.1.p2 GENE.GILK01010405.1~~GILK01010405.1.p2  ORF type:complete len:115 (-),score=20.97 GILK01010405.1:266-610(-)
MIQFAAWTSKKRRGSHWQRFGPMYLILLSLPLVMADLTRHVLQDSGVWPEGESAMFNDDGSLSPIGWLFTIFFTWSGFTLMIVGSLWLANIHTKLYEIYKTIRRKCQNRSSRRR